MTDLGDNEDGFWYLFALMKEVAGQCGYTVVGEPTVFEGPITTYSYELADGGRLRAMVEALSPWATIQVVLEGKYKKADLEAIMKIIDARMEQSGHYIDLLTPSTVVKF